MLPLNLYLIIASVFIGLFLIFLFKDRSELLKVMLIILTFYLARIFFGLEWRIVTGGLCNVIVTWQFYKLLAENFVILSLVFMIGSGLILKRSFTELGWIKEQVFRNILLGLFIGLIFFFLLTGVNPIKWHKLPAAIFFSFFIASWQEENIFRGYLVNYLGKRFNQVETTIYQALIYSFAHIGFYDFYPLSNLIFSVVFAFILGLIFGYLRLKTKSQIPAFMTHAIIDVALFLR